MNLIIDGQDQGLVDIKPFRQQYGLSNAFSISAFEHKDYTDLANIENAGNEMNQLRDTMLNQIPEKLNLQNLLSFVSTFSDRFQIELYAINDSVNLKDVEIDYAVSGFYDVCHALAYALIRSHTQKQPNLPFIVIYMQWLNDSVRLSQDVHDYVHDDENWKIQVINTAYGRIGMKITSVNEVVYVRDSKLACPAEGFMYTLFTDIAQKITLAMPAL